MCIDVRGRKKLKSPPAAKGVDYLMQVVPFKKYHMQVAIDGAAEDAQLIDVYSVSLNGEGGGEYYCEGCGAQVTPAIEGGVHFFAHGAEPHGPIH